MPDSDSLTLRLPESNTAGDKVLSGGQNVVLVGANGSGKSRLGAWLELESPQRERVHRIAAQKSLSMPESVQPKSIEEAEKELLIGRSNIDVDEIGERGLINHKRNARWSKGPVTESLSDYRELMVYLFSEEAKKSTQFRRQALESSGQPPVPSTKLDVVKHIWEEVFPHRELDIGGGQLNTHPPGEPDSAYNAQEMSDGERVAFYLIGECLAAPENGIIVVDEPEIHLHRSIQSDLWNAIEQQRNDCRFVYLTHDLSFASSREAILVWLKGYNGGNWDWRVIGEKEGIPEEVLLSILGSRRPVLFVEGDRESLDYRIYDVIYPKHTVMPCGGCDEVISSTQAFDDLRDLHDLDCCGLIDRDYRTNEEIESLENQSVYVTEVSEIENLLITEEVLRAFGQEKHFDDGEGTNVDTRVQEAKGEVFERLEDEQERLAASIAAHRIRRKLGGFGPDQENKEALEESFEETTTVDIDAIYEKAEGEVSTVLENRNYEEAIKIFDQKGLLYDVAPIFDEEGEAYKDYVVRLLASGHDELMEALKAHVPSLRGGQEEEAQAAPATGAQ
jgi:energy-coupling factor transporter ATP-binding protein EcfA2